MPNQLTPAWVIDSIKSAGDIIKIKRTLLYLKNAVDAVTATVQNGGGGGGSDSNAIYHQTVAQATWTFPHGLSKVPSVIVTDDNGNVLTPDITVSALIVTVSHSYALTGWIYCN